MSDETWNRYCEKLEELRRVQDEARKRRKELPAVEIVNKVPSVVVGIAETLEGGVNGTAEDSVIPIPPPRP